MLPDSRALQLLPLLVVLSSAGAQAAQFEARPTLDWDGDLLLNATDAFPDVTPNPGSPFIDADGDGLAEPDDPDDTDISVPAGIVAQDFSLGPDLTITAGDNLLLNAVWEQVFRGSAFVFPDPIYSVNFSSVDIGGFVASSAGSNGGATDIFFDAGTFSFLTSPGTYTLTGELVGIGLTSPVDTVTVTVAPVPLPASGLLLIAGLGVLSVRRAGLARMRSFDACRHSD